MKPNVFTSCQAAYALVACVGPEVPSIKSFTYWMDSLRDEEGFWRSAAGYPQFQFQWEEVAGGRPQ